MTMLYQNLCYNEVFYKGTALYIIVLDKTSILNVFFFIIFLRKYMGKFMGICYLFDVGKVTLY